MTNPEQGQPGRTIHTRRTLLLVIMVLLTLLICAMLAVWPREPSFRGRSLSQWLGDFDGMPPEKPALQQEEAIRTIGPEALPFLLGYIWSDEPMQLVRARLWINKAFHRRYRSKIDLCAPSWRALAILGPAAKPAIPEITRHAAEGPSKGRAMIALAVLGTNSIPAMIDLCDHTNVEVRVDAAFLLAKSKNKMRGVKSFLATSPFSGQPMLAYNIEQGVGDLDFLLENLRSDQAAVRRATMEAIASLPQLPESEQLKLREYLQDADPIVRATVAKCLDRTQGKVLK